MFIPIVATIFFYSLIAAVEMGALSIAASLMAFILSGLISAYGAEYYYVFQVICGDCEIKLL